MKRPEKLGMSSEKLATLSTSLQQFVDDQTVAGVSALIARRGHVVYRQDFGMADISSNRPMTDDTIFRIASMSKLVVTVGAFTLIEDGLMCRHTPVHEIIPGFAQPSVVAPVAGEPDTTFVTKWARKEMRVNHLLDHTSGLEYRFHNHPVLGPLYADQSIWDGFNTVPADGPMTLGDLVENRLAELPLLFEPGERFNYSLSHDVLGYIIEKVSGQSLAEFLNDRIFEPLEMEDTFFFTENPDQINRFATVYTPTAEGGLTELGDNPVEVFPNFFADGGYPFRGAQAVYSGGAGLSSTVNDYFRFIQMLLNGGVIRPKCGYGTVRILNRDLTNLVLQVKEIDPFMDDFTNLFGWRGYKFNNGAGVHVDPTLSGKNYVSVGQVSWNGAFNTFYFLDPAEELVGVVMTQVVPFDYTKVQATFERLAYEAINERYAE